MATYEQLLFGSRPDGRPGRDVLACSPGLEADCAREIVGVCEGWGRVPAEGVRRPILVALPLESRLGTLGGRLMSVIRIGCGLKPLFHAVVMTDGSYAEFGRNPYEVARSGVFVDAYVAGMVVSRREIAPGANRGVEPPPGRDDVGFVDEALRQLLASQRLEMPLEQPTEESDRFLDLLVSCLPQTLGRELRFASWTPGGRNAVTLAAVQRDAAFFRAWRPYLMSLPLGQITETAESYVAQVRDLLERSDLPGLWQLSDGALVDLGVRTDRSRVRQAPTISATLPPPPEPAQSSGRPASVRGRPATLRDDTARRAPRDPGRASGRTRPPLRRQSGGFRRWVAVLLAAAIVGLGVRELVRGAWSQLPALATAGGVRLHANPRYGILDVGRLHDDALRVVGRATLAGPDDASVEQRHTREILRQAGQLLDTQAQAYIEQVSATLASGGRGDIHAATEALPAGTLAAKGQTLIDELHRLALADVSLVEGPLCRDLSRLDGRVLGARFDSVLAARGGTPPSEIWAVTQKRRREVSTARLRATLLDRVQSLLAARTITPTWTQELAETAGKLESVPGHGAACWRGAAKALAALKQAESRADFQAAALALDDPTAAWRAGEVAAALPALGTSLAAFGNQPAPEILAATVRFYEDLARGWEEAGLAAPDRLAGIMRGLSRSAAVAFDPQSYADHVARLGVAMVQGLRARGLAAEALPDAVFPGGDRQETLEFLAATAAGRDGDGWQREASRFEVPFLARWATQLAQQADATRSARAAAFATAYRDLATRARTVSERCAADLDPGEARRSLLDAATNLLRDHPDGFAGQAEASRRWRRVAALRDALVAPLALELGGVTVRMAPDADPRGPVVVELTDHDGTRLVSPPFELGPAAPAGTGWVGMTPLTWRLVPRDGDRLAVTVRRVADQREILRATYDPWLTGAGPDALTRFLASDGGKVSWRLGRGYWSQLRLPPLD